MIGARFDGLRPASCSRKVCAISAALLLGLAGQSQRVSAQELEPRRYAPAPVGVNFLAFVYGYSSGNVLLDPTLPIEGAKGRIHVGVVRYVRTVNVLGASGRVSALLPGTAGDWEGTLDGELRQRKIDGFGDLRAALSVNFIGAPALPRGEFREYRPGTIVGASVGIIAPTGQYDSSKIVNLSGNRWVFRPQVGVSRVFGRWTAELAATGWFFTDNTDFFNGQLLEQRPLFALQAHAVYTWRPGLWLGIGGGYASGGRTHIDGVRRETLQRNTRLGFVFAYPLSAAHGLRLTAGTSVTTRTGSDFRTLGVAYQYAWGGR